MRLISQIAIWLLLAIGVGATIGGVVDTGDTGTFGLVGVPSRAIAGVTLVQSIDPGSPAAMAGIKAGDQLHVVPTAANRIMLFSPVPGDRITLRDGSRSIDLVAAVDHSQPGIVVIIIAVVARVAFLAIAALIAWRRPDDAASRALALFLACFGVGLDFDFGLLPALWARFACAIFVQTLFAIGGVAAFAFACRFPVLPGAGVRNLLNRFVMPMALVGVTLSVGDILLSYFDSAISAQARPLFIVPYVVWYVTVIVLAFVAFVDSYRSTVAADRVRVRWVIGTFAVGFSGIIVLFAGLAAGISGSTAQVLQYIALTVLAIPFGLGYVILRHRMLDIGFVVNRAVVYTGVSLVIVGAFILFEWLVGHVVEVKGNASEILQLAAALALGLSARFIHARVDRYVDDFFFRERHLAEASIRRFAHEAMLITDPVDLTVKTTAVAQDKARLAAVAFYARKDDSYVALQSTFDRAPDISENDYAVLDMRTYHQRVDLLDKRSDIPGEIAFPMIVRGKLAGFLACGPKTTHEALAPDERDALALLARDAGVALDSLRVRTIERELGFLSYDDTLPAAIRARLAGLVAPE